MKHYNVMQVRKETGYETKSRADAIQILERSIHRKQFRKKRSTALPLDLHPDSHFLHRTIPRKSYF
jgi:ribonuclease HII